MGFPCGSVGKESAFSAGDPGSISGLGRFPGEGNGNPLQYPWPGKSHGQRSLVGCSPWGCKELDTTDQLTLLLIRQTTGWYFSFPVLVTPKQLGKLQNEDTFHF